MTEDLSKLAQFCTVRQLEHLEAFIKHGTHRKAAEATGCTKNAVRQSIALIKRKAALSLISEHGSEIMVPEGFAIKGTSTYRNTNGVGQWVKTEVIREKYDEACRAAMREFFEELPTLVAPAGPTNYSTDLIPWVQIGDAHIGMLAHAAEVGENFDLKIAERELCASIKILIDEMPSCERMVLNDLGDFTHYENYTATTEASGHQLDYDSRFPKMISVYSRIMRFIVDLALTKAKFVDIIVNQGNHSRTNDLWMAELLRVAYGGTDRVHVLDNSTVFIGYRMGNTFVMTHHSDKCKPKDLVNVMITDFRKDFGETEFHYIDIGHIHHGMAMKEHPSVTLESWNHLAAPDKWAHDFGYRSKRSISVVLRSKTFGEVGRRVLPIQEIRARMDKAAGHSVVGSKIAYTV